MTVPDSNRRPPPGTCRPIDFLRTTNRNSASDRSELNVPRAICIPLLRRRRRRRRRLRIPVLCRGLLCRRPRSGPPGGGSGTSRGPGPCHGPRRRRLPWYLRRYLDPPLFCPTLRSPGCNWLNFRLPFQNRRSPPRSRNPPVNGMLIGPMWRSIPPWSGGSPRRFDGNVSSRTTDASAKAVNRAAKNLVWTPVPSFRQSRAPAQGRRLPARWGCPEGRPRDASYLLYSTDLCPTLPSSRASGPSLLSSAPADLAQ